MRKRLVRLVAVAMCLSTIGVAQAAVGTTGAQAFQWANHHGIGSGENVFGGVELLTWNEVEPLGSGIICAGIRSISLSCPPSAENWRITISEQGFYEPYAHNHSTFTSGFSAYEN
jgi:hypothetical protein